MTDGRAKKRGWFSLLVRWGEAFLAGAVLLLAAGSLVDGRAWLPSVASELAAQGVLATLVGMAFALVRRRWVVLGLLACAAGVLALRVPLERAPRAHGDAATDLRLFVHNTSTRVEDLRGLLANAVATDPDVIVLVEAPPDLIRLFRRERPLEEEYPHVLMRGPSPERTSWRVVLSRWPLEDRRTPDEMRCVVVAPFGRFGLIAVHPASPRDQGRWEAGNRLVQGAGASAAEFQREGLPVVVAGDLNSTPSGPRSRALCTVGGLLRCKPLTRPVGTFPAMLPGVLRIALDDVWVSPGWRVGMWEIGDSVGSDHAPLLVDLVLSE